METLYYRKRNMIMNSDGELQKFDSVNAAKRESRRLQKEVGVLGSGVLRVVDKFPKVVKSDAQDSA
ncbi:hypothetical protein CL634_02125 [bacterium]|nr:hypothetical protein [bacterium]|tara:strand:- start:1347 stop:1544 length:198 start_codon:yes stop_codon:yes gene_type:complete